MSTALSDLVQTQDFTEYVAMGDNTLDDLLEGRVEGSIRRQSPIARRAARMAQDSAYADRVLANMNLIQGFYSGRESLKKFKAAMTTSDFSSLFSDTLDRMIIQGYDRYPKTYRQYLKIGSVRDFREVERFRMSGGQDGLTKVPEGGDYEEGKRDTASYSFGVAKYGKLFKITMEALVNDDLDAFRALPEVMAEDAAMSENKFAVALYAANTTLFSATHAVNGVNYSNISTKTLTLANLKVELAKMAAYIDEDGNPVMNAPVYLVVSPALHIPALEIVTQISPNTVGDVNVIAANNMLQVVVEPFLPIVDPTNGATSWYLFAPATARNYAAEMAFLQGHEEPQVFIRESNARALSGGNYMPDANFETDTVAWKIRHIWGGSHANPIGGWRFALWSNGTVA